VNYANADMVGHTGIQQAIKEAVSTVDHCLDHLEKEALRHGWILVITADHGNVDELVDQKGQPHTAHTCNPVPFLVINHPFKPTDSKGTLADIAPTLLHWLKIPIPTEMTGQCLSAVI
jgi:2,3-bisphosphoglycerate-independent phosphoglycerate mutase